MGSTSPLLAALVPTARRSYMRSTYIITRSNYLSTLFDAFLLEKLVLSVYVTLFYVSLSRRNDIFDKNISPFGLLAVSIVYAADAPAEAKTSARIVGHLSLLVG